MVRKFFWEWNWPLMNFHAYWILWSMFQFIILQLYNFLFSLKTPSNPFKKLTASIIEPLFKIKIVWPTTRFFTKSFLTPTPNHFGRSGTCHDITKSAGSQANNKPSYSDSMTAKFYKNVYKDLSPKQLRTEDLRKQEKITKISKWMKTDISSQFPF